MRINEEIRAREVRLVGDTGEQLGIFPFREAARIAQEKGLDIVEVAPNARPPVCRLMDYGKYKYEQSKREREARKKQKIVTIKEIKIRPNIEEHDLEVKTKNAIRFLKEGDKVKVTVMFRGREISHAALSKELCHRLAKNVGEFGVMEKEPRVEGRNMIMILSPKHD
ncbi:MAG: translation initiation factor IF-3 [Syntrophomonadaceae bacterium]|nr:translation initiation factor IF-3 [Syntrophomonadaceae bacterium]